MLQAALILVDLQNDFLEGGALGAPNSNSILSAVNRYVTLFEDEQLPIIATRDWHPPNHISFIMRGGKWPPHCIMGTHGAEFPKELKLPRQARIVSKASDPERDAYSGFDGTDLNEGLNSLNVRDLFICGIATEYCVKSTVMDALRNGFRTVLLVDAVAAINNSDGEEAIREMQRNGCKLASLQDTVKLLGSSQRN